MVLPFLLFVLLVLTALATVSIHVALQEVVIARASAGLLQARLSAEGSVRAALAEVPADRLRALEPGSSELLMAGELASNSPFSVRARPLLGGFVLIEGIGFPAGRGGGGGGEYRVGRVVWVLDPVRELTGFSAAVEHGGDFVGGEVGGGPLRSQPADWPDDLCRGLGDTHEWTSALPGSSRVELAEPILGPLTLERMIGLADVVVEGTITPVPVSRGGICATETEGNWGAPSDPRGPCGNHMPLVASSGSLHFAGGEAQGILVVAGDLTLSGGARFAGLVLTGGDVTAEDESRIDGLVRARGAVTLSSGATVAISGCAAARALAAPPALQRALSVSEGSWLGTF